MKKAVIFDIHDKKKDQVAAEMLMTPNERLLLCLNLMELSIAMSGSKKLKQQTDDIEWIEVKFKDSKSNS